MKPTIPFGDFEKIELKIGSVREAEEVANSNKLIKLVVEIDGERRQIIAGIRKSYEPSFLVGKQIVVITNLEPRSLAGLESQGMVLAAYDKDGLPVILMPERIVPDGSEIR